MYLVHGQVGQQGQAVFHITVVHITPVLIKIVGRGLFGVQPQGALFGFAHFFALAIGQELAGHAVGRLLHLATNQLHATQHVGPLVVAAQFHNAIVILMQLPEVIGLHNHVVEFKEGQALFPTFFEAFSGEHAVYRKMHAYLSEQAYIVQVEQPISVVGNNGLALAKVDEAAHLLFEAGNIVLNELGSEHLAHFVLAAGVANHAGTAAQKHDGAMACLLHMAHHHQSNKVTHMQAVGSGVKANIESDFFFL